MHMTLTSQDGSYRAAAEQFGGAIARLARGYEADPGLADDLVQDIHAALWRSFAYFEGQCSVRSWVYRIAHNTAVSHVQSRMRQGRGGLVSLEDIEPVASDIDTEATADASQTSTRLMATIHRLAPADRQVMLLYLEDLTAAEIGEVTGLSAAAVATRIHRIKGLLARQFSTQEDNR